MINFEDTEFWIYVTSDSTACFDCKKIGHIARNCSNRSNAKPFNRKIDCSKDHPNFFLTQNESSSLEPAPPLEESTSNPSKINPNQSFKFYLLFLKPGELESKQKRPLSFFRIERRARKQEDRNINFMQLQNLLDLAKGSDNII